MYVKTILRPALLRSLALLAALRGEGRYGAGKNPDFDIAVGPTAEAAHLERGNRLVFKKYLGDFAGRQCLSAGPVLAF